MIKRKTFDKYQFPEFARGTLIEHLENGLHKVPIEKSKTVRDFWHTITNYFK